MTRIPLINLKLSQEGWKVVELIISFPAHIPHSKMGSQKGSIDTYQRNGSCFQLFFRDRKK
jgi:hypothetical protein